MVTVPVGVDTVPPVLSTIVTVQIVCVLTGTFAPLQVPATEVVVGSRTVIEVLFELASCLESP